MKSGEEALGTFLEDRCNGYWIPTGDSAMLNLSDLGRSQPSQPEWSHLLDLLHRKSGIQKAWVQLPRAGGVVEGCLGLFICEMSMKLPRSRARCTA